MPIKKLTTKFKKAKIPRGIQAAGGIVVRAESEPLIAVVQLRRLGHWVLPKGKLNAGEDALTAARREVLEETGHQVSIHEYLGALSYEVRRGPKVVQFWRMQATGGPVRKLMRDVKAVRWLPIGQAIEILTHPREQAFLAQVGPAALKATEHTARKPKPSARPDEIAPPRAEIVAPGVALPADSVPNAAPPEKKPLEKFWAWIHGKAE
jgi:8-oxo-dGTP diphosphatase